ncbi:MAG: hypothetical protein ACLQBA_04070 [Candidatus Binataceae bacterium]
MTKRIGIFICFSVIICSGVAMAAKVEVGGRTLSIPAPESFSQATTPRMLRFGELSTIKEDRLLAVFGETRAVEVEAKGGTFLMDKYSLVQATRGVEPYQIPLDRFAKYKSDTKAQTHEGLSAEDEAEVQKNVDSAAKWIASGMGTKLAIGIPRIGTVSILDETPTSLTMITLIEVPVSVGGGKTKTVEMAEGISQVLVKSKVIWLQLYARSPSHADFDWVATTILKWTRAVGAANT